MQLKLAAALIVLAALTAPAFADGELQLRAVYYKEQATRVQQPMIDGRFDAGEHGSVEAHVLVDAITSASTASSAEGNAFTETRFEAGGGYTHTIGTYAIGGSARYSTEPDYKSAFGIVHGQAEFLKRNLTVNLTLGGGQDDIKSFMTPVGELHSYLASASVAQIVSPNAIASLTYDLSYLDGYQENPYRTVRILSPTTASLAMERVPDQRVRHAIAASGRWFREASATTLIASYRFYFDDWGVRAHTPELRVIQDVGETMQVGLRYRYHRQGAADFYQDTYPTQDAAIEPFLTDDEKLSRFDSHTIALKFGVTGATFGLEQRLSAVRGELIIEYNVQDNAFGNAGVAHAAVTIPFEY